ncbi:hypothetical protein KAI04_03165 [Candidatus Pacearchaeota archaeon]|nr:hypothetical protein [Candidatus Pacearchaeota archaeon]
MKNKTVLGLMTLSIVAILSVGLIAAFSGNGIMHSDLSEDQTEIEAFKLSIQEAIENANFEEWKALMESQLTQEHFNELVEKQHTFNEQLELKEQMMQAWENQDYETMTQFKEQMHSENYGEEKAMKIQTNKGNFENNDEFQGKRNMFQKFRFWDRE